MSTEALTAKARRHWKQWLPARTAELKASGEWEAATHAAAAMAQQEINRLVAMNWPYHAAEEVALKAFILLAPEPGAELDDWEAEELAESEAAYQAMMRESQAIMDREDPDE